jgi:hypothetical protein
MKAPTHTSSLKEKRNQPTIGLVTHSVSLTCMYVHPSSLFSKRLGPEKPWRGISVKLALAGMNSVQRNSDLIRNPSSSINEGRMVAQGLPPCPEAGAQGGVEYE